MAERLDLTAELGPLFEVEVSRQNATAGSNLFEIEMDTTATKEFTLEVGVKSSSLLANPGGGGASVSNIQELQIVAVESLGLYRAVTIDGNLCQLTEASLSAFAGVTRTTVGVGEVANVVSRGSLYEAGWNWTPDMPILIGSNGVLTQSQATLPIRRIGYAMSANRIMIDPFNIIGG